jgi:hypothetical protein
MVALNIRRLIDDGHSVVITSDRTGQWHLHDGPPVTFISQRCLDRDVFRWGDYGYLPVYKDPARWGYRAVWPLPLWFLHVMGHGAWLLAVNMVVYLRRRNLVHFDCSEAAIPRFRDLRLGRGT